MTALNHHFHYAFSRGVCAGLGRGAGRLWRGARAGGRFLAHLPNLLPAPHLGFMTETTSGMYGGTVKAVTEWLDGQAV